jgi:two-component system sensor histidine kinase RpfC
MIPAFQKKPKWIDDARSRIQAGINWCRATLRSRVDSEHEMTLNRLVLSGAAFGYLLLLAWLGRPDASAMIHAQGRYFVLYQLVALALFIHLLFRPTVSTWRRIIGMSVDLGFFSYGMYVGGEAFAPLYPVYLWVIFGNGFRFGVPYLVAASGIGVIAFGVVVATTDYWRSHLSLSFGLAAGLIVLPAYVSTLIRKLSEAKRQAEEASRAKSAFLASMSHEFRTPLNAIIGLSDLLVGTALSSEQKKMCATICDSGRRLLTLVDSVLDFSRAEAGLMPAKAVAFDLIRLLAEIKNVLSVAAEAKGLRLSMHCSARTPPLVIGTKGHLENILINLLGNAVKFTQCGYVVVSVDAVDRNAEKVRLRFEVTDTGIGIGESEHGRIFDRFTQANESIIDRYGGSGLGLAIAQQLVELQGGTIGVQSSLGQGSTFWFEVDVTQQERPAPVEHLNSMPIILISKNNAIKEIVGTCAKDVTFVADADEGADVLRRREAGDRSAIIYDGSGKTMDDAALSEWMRKDIVTDASPILLVDASAGGLPTSAVRSRFVTLLRQPLNREALASALQIASATSRGEERESSDGESVISTRRPLTILVAEDNRTNQMVVTKVLERAGHRVAVVENGEAAFDALAAKQFDLAILDVNMPVMNGIEATKLYRFAEFGPSRLPILALTADATDDTKHRCEEAGMDACLTKPVKPLRLIAAIDELMEKAGLEARRDCAIPASAQVQPNSVAQRVPIDVETLDSLEKLGGEKFVQEIAEQFIQDGAAILRNLGRAMASHDVQAFRALLHALRSASANVGASGVYDMCLEWRVVAQGELADDGYNRLNELRNEFERIRVALNGQISKRSVA